MTPVSSEEGATVDYPLSEVSRLRLWRNSVVSLLGAAFGVSLLLLTGNLWLIAAIAVFTGLFAYRRLLMRRADPHVRLTPQAIEINWVFTKSVPLTMVTSIGFASDLLIVLSYHSGKQDKVAHLRIVRWRLQDGGRDLVARVRHQCGLSD